MDKESRRVPKLILVLSLLIVELVSHPVANSSEDFEAWIARQSKQALHYLLQNSAQVGAKPGAVVASPSKVNPNYFYHWVRDSATDMKVIGKLYASNIELTEKAKYKRILIEFSSFSRQLQLTPNRSGGLGEPKFNVDGTAFNGDWGRHQNDGPPTRAIALIQFANALLAEGESEFVRAKLYDGKLPTNSVIKADLEYISHHWRETSYDLWEEVRGHHFYTRVLEKKALVRGAQLAHELGDHGAAVWYAQQAILLENEILLHWDSQKKYIVATRNRNAGVDYKHSGLDSSIVLAVLDAEGMGNELLAEMGKLLATVFVLESTFQKLYPINQNSRPGIAIGRYPEDRYDGYRTDSEGNPWFLTTNSFAEFYYRLSRRFRLAGRIEISPLSVPFYQALLGLGIEIPVGHTVVSADPLFEQIVTNLTKKGDLFLMRIWHHSNTNGTFSEQMNQRTGYMQGAPSLSLSYASFLSAAWARKNDP